MTSKLDFEAERDDGSESWDRSDPLNAVICRMSWREWAVALPDGDEAHICELHHDGRGYQGRCDCQGFKFHSGPCAHLIALRKADALGLHDARGDRIELASDDRRHADDIEDAVDRAATDGGRNR
ncbi:SWIM zinc finger domain protein [Natronomonas pharaonis DSM 2160]|uniref:SWIM zinc finger domain protein n=1 Tax=Natronomonas pharaonis (strain ATCC 35678 / DSM 2160 / CIP 103997 / JCM 8858 / NBRC 14720 / NCIMB 2260 / Gabara) TaxID=348780 RepID=A0A1U7EW12_NATPD|nr:SWIM zinc finger family protein [Natronomonas pharaonis]CAI49255.1 SWIM zinc finger domain protein [Natronomonas pharaonis DSM 2160]